MTQGERQVRERQWRKTWENRFALHVKIHLGDEHKIAWKEPLQWRLTGMAPFVAAQKYAEGVKLTAEQGTQKPCSQK